MASFHAASPRLAIMASPARPAITVTTLPPRVVYLTSAAVTPVRNVTRHEPHRCVLSTPLTAQSRPIQLDLFPRSHPTVTRPQAAARRCIGVPAGRRARAVSSLPRAALEDGETETAAGADANGKPKDGSVQQPDPAPPQATRGGTKTVAEEARGYLEKAEEDFLQVCLFWAPQTSPYILHKTKPSCSSLFPPHMHYSSLPPFPPASFQASGYSARSTLSRLSISPSPHQFTHHSGRALILFRTTSPPHSALHPLCCPLGTTFDAQFSAPPSSLPLPPLFPPSSPLSPPISSRSTWGERSSSPPSLGSRWKLFVSSQAPGCKGGGGGGAESAAAGHVAHHRALSAGCAGEDQVQSSRVNPVNAVNAVNQNQDTLNRQQKDYRQLSGRQRVVGIACDVRSARDVQMLADVARQELGRADIWVNNAGTNPMAKPFIDFEDHELEQVVSTNLLGSLLCTRAAMRLMQQQPSLPDQTAGHVFNLEGAGSWGGATPQYAAYGATKCALRQLGASLVEEERVEGRVGIHAASPGLVLTDLLLSGATVANKQAFNIVGEHPETVARVLVPQMRTVKGTGSTVSYLTPPRIVLAILSAWMRRGRWFDLQGQAVYATEAQRLRAWAEGRERSTIGAAMDAVPSTAWLSLASSSLGVCLIVASMFLQNSGT
ncbi:unnamed protein product [Closterium sp. Yama58-4]|nr:unnamed protein product [Closterium sp. Yama58-4]